jgi:hypothetical protein
MNFFILKYSPYFLFLSFFEESKIVVTPVRMKTDLTALPEKSHFAKKYFRFRQFAKYELTKPSKMPAFARFYNWHRPCDFVRRKP